METNHIFNHEDDTYLLTTKDNPYNPFDQFDLWFMYDIEMGYNSCGRLARVARISDNMSQQEEEAEVKRAIDTIIANDFLNIYKRFYKQTATVENA